MYIKIAELDAHANKSSASTPKYGNVHTIVPGVVLAGAVVVVLAGTVVVVAVVLAGTVVVVVVLAGTVVVGMVVLVLVLGSWYNVVQTSPHCPAPAVPVAPSQLQQLSPAAQRTSLVQAAPAAPPLLVVVVVGVMVGVVVVGAAVVVGAVVVGAAVVAVGVHDTHASSSHR